MGQVVRFSLTSRSLSTFYQNKVEHEVKIVARNLEGLWYGNQVSCRKGKHVADALSKKLMGSITCLVTQEREGSEGAKRTSNWNWFTM